MLKIGTHNIEQYHELSERYRYKIYASIISHKIKEIN